MKKIYLLGLMGCFAFANAQAPKRMDAKVPALKAQSARTDHSVPAPSAVRPSTRAMSKAGTEVKVGETNFDRQTNSSVYRRIMTYPGNKISVIWTTSTDGPTNNYLGRGTGYNHFNGSTWGTISQSRIENARAGYPDLNYSPVMNKEIILSHRVDTNGKSGGLLLNKNLSIGSNIWTSDAVLTEPTLPNSPTVLWPRTAISGNYMHIIATYTSPSAGQTDTMIKAGVRNPNVYSRYNMATDTWEEKNITLPGYDNSRWFNGNADAYAIDARGSNVAVLMGDATADITLWKSTDNGQTWSQTIIDSFPVPAFNDQVTITDTPRVSDGSLSVKIDDRGMAHCFWGRLRVLNSAANDNTFSVFLGTNSIDYWYEGRADSGIASVGFAPDMNNDNTLNVGTIDSRTRYGNSGVSTMPYAGIDTAGNIWVIYSALTDEDLDGGGSGFRDIYCVFSMDNGNTWSTPRNLTQWINPFEEQMFASMAPTITDKLDLTYMRSSAQGFFDTDDNPGKLGPFDIMYMSVPLSRIIAQTVGTPDASSNEAFTVNQNYPNPFSGSTIIPVSFKNNSDATVTVKNIVGQAVYTKSFTNVSTGFSELEITPLNLNSGVYFYTVEAKGYKVTNKMIVE